MPRLSLGGWETQKSRPGNLAEQAVKSLGLDHYSPKSGDLRTIFRGYVPSAPPLCIFKTYFLCVGVECFACM